MHWKSFISQAVFIFVAEVGSHVSGKRYFFRLLWYIPCSKQLWIFVLTGACFTKYLISKLNLNETQLVMKAMLKTTSTSVFVIETSIRNLPLVFLSKALFEHISLLNEEFTCNNSLISTISYTFKYVYTFRVYVYTILFSVLHHSGCTTWASVKHDCLVCIQ